MYKLIRKLENVREPRLLDSGIFYQDSRDYSLLYTDQNFNAGNTLVNAPFGFSCDSGQHIVIKNDRLVFLDVTGHVQKELAFTYDEDMQIKLLNDNDTMIIRKKVKDNEWKLCKYDLRKQQIIWEVEDRDVRKICSRSGDYLITIHYENSSLLSCFSESTGALLWQLNVNELGLPPGKGYEPVFRFQVLNDYFFTGFLQGLQNIYLLAVDIATGQLLWHAKDLGFKFQVSDNKLFSYAGKGILEVDPLSGAILHEAPVFEKMAAANIDPYGNVVFKDGDMYLAGIEDTIISIWDIDTGEIKWRHRLYDKGTGRRGISIPASDYMIQIHADRMIVLDSENMLHVFERV